MSGNPVQLAKEALELRALGDALLAMSKAKAAEAAQGLGRGSLFPRLADGSEGGSFIVPQDSTVVDVDQVVLLPWVKHWYPSEVMEMVRPAFVEKLRDLAREHGRPTAPDGEADIPGVTLSTEPAKGPRITVNADTKRRAAAAVEAALDSVLSGLVRPELPGGTA